MINNIPELIISTDDPCRNRWGCVKVKLVRELYPLGCVDSHIPDLISLYVDWRDTTEFIPMRLKYLGHDIKNFDNTLVDPLKWIDRHSLPAVLWNDNPSCNTVAYQTYYYKWVNKKSVKRGNDVYIALLQKKFAPLFNASNHIEFFSTTENKNRKRIKKTRMLYITGTCDNTVTGGISASWLTFGEYWNLFTTKLRDKFGDVAYIRAWQSQDNGYPHFHALIYFYDFEFTAVYWNQDKTYRVHNRQKMIVDKRTGKKEYVRDFIKGLWGAGNLDVQCCGSSKEALRDLLKYILRDLEGGASDLTNTMVWYFNKKTFAISKKFFELFGVTDASLEPSDADLINAEGVTQEVTQEDKLISIDVFPGIPREMMPYYQQLTLNNWDHPPDPPPELIEFLENFADSCVPSKYKYRDDGIVVTIYKYKYQDWDKI